MVAAEPEIGPGGSAAQTLVLHHRRVRQQLIFLAVMFQAFVGAQPDAIAEAVPLPGAFACAAARPVALVLGALRFRTEKCDIGQRTIAAVPALIQKRFAQMLQRTQWPGTLLGICGVPIQTCTPIRQRATMMKH